MAFCNNAFSLSTDIEADKTCCENNRNQRFRCSHASFSQKHAYLFYQKCHKKSAEVLLFFYHRALALTGNEALGKEVRQRVDVPKAKDRETGGLGLRGDTVDVCDDGDDLVILQHEIARLIRGIAGPE
jgi:hypothetical protein